MVYILCNQPEPESKYELCIAFGIMAIRFPCWFIGIWDKRANCIKINAKLISCKRIRRERRGRFGFTEISFRAFRPQLLHLVDFNCISVPAFKWKIFLVQLSRISIGDYRRITVEEKAFLEKNRRKVVHEKCLSTYSISKFIETLY